MEMRRRMGVIQINRASSIVEMATDADAKGRGVLVVRPGRSAGDVIGVGVLIAKNSNTLFKAA